MVAVDSVPFTLTLILLVTRVASFSS